MLKSILVGLDGTADSQAGADLALRWAAAAGATAVGLGVVDEPGICAPQMAPIGGDSIKEARDAAVLARATRAVDGFLADFRERAAAAGVPARAARVQGDPPTRLVEHAQRCDMIVLGRHTRFSFATRAGPDDTLRRVLRDAPRPVVTVPENPAAGTAVVVAYDGSLQAARALYAFRASGLDRGRAVHLVVVGDDAGPLDRAAEFLAAHDIPATPHVVPAAGSVAQTLLDTARGLGAGLVVAGAYGRSTLREFFLGSVTQTLLQEAAVPLLLFH